MTWRAEFSRRSGPALRLLAGLPRWVMIFIVVAVLVVGLLVRGPIGALAVGVLALFLGWLLTLSWPALAPPARLLRLAVVAGLVALAATRL